MANLTDELPSSAVQMRKALESARDFICSTPDGTPKFTVLLEVMAALATTPPMEAPRG